MKRFSKIGIGFLLLMVTHLSSGTILQVPQMFPTIVNAVQNSLPYDTILISPGMYYEQIVIRNHPLTFAGAFLFSNDTNDIQSTILLPPDSTLVTTTRSVFVFNNTPFIQLIGLTIRNGQGTRVILNPSNPTMGTYFGGNIKADTTNLWLNHCRILRGIAHKGGGIGLRNSNLYIYNTLIDSCSGTSLYRNGGGISGDPCDTVIIANSTIQNNNHAKNGGGVYLDAQYCIITHCLFYNNVADTIGGAGFLTKVRTIENNVFLDNKASRAAVFWINNYAIPTSETFIFKNNIVSNSFQTPSLRPSQQTLGIYFDNSSNHIWQVEDNLFINNHSNYYSGNLITMQFGTIHFRRNQFIHNSALTDVLFSARQNVTATFDSNYFFNNASNPLMYYQISSMNAENNDFIQNQGVLLEGISITASAINNYWGHPSGPRTASNPGGQGDSLPPGIPYIPFRTTPVFPELDVRDF
ncbi:MAG: right-handed parallel beta-helix repeat-containing protein, partial [bacterium]|nr:right-handed parallel beta-helix repeat-containing protein [bacterium]